jgi:magnesium-transporting ATPase (P-type)
MTFLTHCGDAPAFRYAGQPIPLDHQVRRVAWLIAVIAVAMAAGFMPVATLGVIPFTAALVLAVGLIAGNVPEGLLPVITLAGDGRA